jgi:predicted dehydrogenase
MTRATFSERTIGSGTKKGQTIPVSVQTHIAGVLQFENGAIGTVVTSFDIKGYQIGLEIHGTHGSIKCPDPNTFGGPVFVRKIGEREWSEAKLTHSYEGEARGIGTADMAVAMQTGRAHRANGDVTYHTLDIMHAIHDAAREGRQLSLKSAMQRPSPMPMNLRDGELDA